MIYNFKKFRHYQIKVNFVWGDIYNLDGIELGNNS